MDSPSVIHGGGHLGEVEADAQSGLQTPVLLLIFNRPETTRAVMRSLREVRPSRLYIAADGPRPDRSVDVDLCAAARQEAASVDWPCEVHTLFRDSNLGCGVGVSTGINWFFANEEHGIVLEDDCVPRASFYRFCRELLEYYRQDDRIMHIAGANFQYGRKRGTESYYFSRYVNVWGWASWRRAWNVYDFDLRPAWELNDTWDTQWQLSLEKAGGLAIVPNSNLVKNIGYGAGATHTREGERAANMEAEEIHFPLRHPDLQAPNRSADFFTYYVLHRQVRFPSMIPMYRVIDWVYPRLKAIKRRLVRTMRRTGPIVAITDPSALGGADPTQTLPDRELLSKDRLLGVLSRPVREMIRRYLAWRRAKADARRYNQWLESGRPIPPPPLYKQMVVRAAATEHGASVLIETGTFLGEMVEALKGDYSRIFTIELDQSLSARAAERFRDYPHILVVHGESGAMLPSLLNQIDEPAVFWLDAHCSGAGTAGDPHQSPIMRELEAIAQHSIHHEHVIIIDDAREFTGKAYPDLRTLESWARGVGYDQMQIENDIIKIWSSTRATE